MANSTSRFHDLVLTIDTLLFIATPHRSSEQLVWENLLLKSLNATNISYRGGLSEILSGLGGSVTQLSNVFDTFAANYKITNIISDDGGYEYEPKKFNTAFQEVISRSKADDEMLCCSIQDVEYLETIRKAFTPRYVKQDPYIQGHQLQPDVGTNIYFELLQRLSPSRRLVYINQTMECMEDFENLKKIYELYIKETSIKKTFGHSVEIVSPKINIGTALLKLLCREIVESSSAVVIESSGGSQPGKNTRYIMYMSFIHQIISQRPSLFLPIENMATEIMAQNVWTEEVFHLFLSSILFTPMGRTSWL
ncbi:hypothetical protein V8C42DRAFT_340175 [Trichoderma barbatum]